MCIRDRTQLAVGERVRSASIEPLVVDPAALAAHAARESAEQCQAVEPASDPADSSPEIIVLRKTGLDGAEAGDSRTVRIRITGKQPEPAASRQTVQVAVAADESRQMRRRLTLTTRPTMPCPVPLIPSSRKAGVSDCASRKR